MSAPAFVVVLIIDLHFPEAHSLKDKRQQLSSVKAQLTRRLGVAVAEVDHHDLWQRATLIAALVGGSARRVDEAADEVVRWLDARFPAGVSVERRLASIEDLRGIGA